MSQRFPILSAAVANPPTTLPLQPYFLTQTALELLGLFEPDSRRFRVADRYLQSELQRLLAGVPLLDTMPERALDEQEMAQVRALAGQISQEWREVAAYFVDPDLGHKPHWPDELKEFLFVNDEVSAPGRRSRPSALARSFTGD